MKTLNKAFAQASEYIFLSFQAEPHPPVFFRVSVQKLFLCAFIAVGLMVLGAIFSLFFFRELELNRKLEEKILALETDNQLVQLRMSKATFEVPLSPLPTPIPISTADPKTKSEPSPAIPRPAQPRVSDLSSRCSEENCEVKLSLVPTGSGAVEGQVVLILELDVPRIGGTPGVALERKQHIAYPGFQVWDEFDPSALQDLEKRPFKFSRGLQTSVSFAINKLLKPVAIHAYLFNNEGTLIQQDRRQTEREDLE